MRLRMRLGFGSVAGRVAGGLPRIRAKTLAGRFLTMQLVIVLVVLVAVAVVSVAQSDSRFRQSEGRRMLAAAEAAAGREVLRAGLEEGGAREVLAPTADSIRALAGTDHLVVHDNAGRPVLLDPEADPEPPALDDPGVSAGISGRSWSGVTTIAGDRVVAGAVPVIGDGGVVLGVVVAGVDYPSVGELLILATPNLMLYLGIGSLLGGLGSVLLARRVKRQTLGLEPEEITRLVERREAMLHGIKEGLLGLDTHGRITLVNDPAVRMLGIPAEPVGRNIDDLGLSQELQDVLEGRVREPDTLVAIGDKLVALNWRPLRLGGSTVGSVTTMRDRTDLLELQHELATTKNASDTLRAQAHEFSNRLHVISGLLELEEYDEAAAFVQQVGGARANLSAQVTERVHDPSLAALLIAKASLADEQSAQLRVTHGSRLLPVSPSLSEDLVAVVGNLVDNALDSVGRDDIPVVDRWVEVDLRGGGGGTTYVVVRDSGPGVPRELADEVFQRGWSTKETGGRQRGLGLAIVSVICARRGGTVTVGGSEFTATLPESPETTEEAAGVRSS